MATEVVLPQWDMGMQEGTVLQWLKREGDPVHEGDELAEIETAKATDMLFAPASGTLARIIVAEGETVRVRTVLCVIAEPGEEVAVAASPADALSREASPADPQSREAAAPAPAWVGASASAAPVAAMQVEPRARRLAQEKGVDLAQVKGTGPGGRITEADVRKVLQRGNSPEGQVIPLTGMRGAIASRMLASLQNSAQFTITTAVNVTALVALRERLKPQFDLTFSDLVIKAALLALKAHPYMNAIVDGEQIRILPEIHIGVAVALEKGLIVPVLRQADRKSLAAIAKESRELIQRAREGELSSAEITGSTFSISNLGMYGVDAFTPVINPPEVAILGVGRIVEQPVRRNAELVWQQMMTLSLTTDHRAVDGAPAAIFLQTLAQLLEQPAALEA